MHAYIHTLDYSSLNRHLHVHHLYLYPTTIGPCPESSPLIITVTTSTNPHPQLPGEGYVFQ